MSDPQPHFRNDALNDALLADAQQALAELQREHALLLKQQATLLHCLSHDLRTPTMTILGFTDLLLADSGKPSDTQTTRQYLEHVRNSANRQVTMIGALISLCSLNHKVLEPTQVKLTTLAQECLQQRADVAALAGTQFDFQATPGVHGDAQLLHQVVAALLDNAIKFTRKTPAPVICFGAEPDTNPAVFFMKDNGVGINMERQDRLFKPFSRLHSAKDFAGIGIGLAVAQLILQRHGGRIWAQSQPDQGATFYFTLG